MVRVKYLYIIGFCLFFILPVYGQKKEIRNAQKLLRSLEYDQLEVHLDSLEKISNDLIYHKGLLHFARRDLDEAFDTFQEAYNSGYDKGQILYFLASIHHLRGEYAQAASAYKLYLSTLKKDHRQRETIKQEIQHCGHAIRNSYVSQSGFVESLLDLNSIGDEIKPIFSPNFSDRIYFSSARKGTNGGLRNAEGLSDEEYGTYSHDIFMAERKESGWALENHLPPFLNTAQEDIVEGFLPESNGMLLRQSVGQEQSQFVVDTFSQSLEDVPYLWEGPLSAELGDRDLHVVNDSTIIFSSKREGGFGGYDLYISQKNTDQWSDPKNLGPLINSAYDERSPFLTNSTTVLYFSSNRPEGFGGYDIFKIAYGLEGGSWQSATNLNPPFSSPGDDLHFRLNEEGKYGLFSSNRKESQGGFDLFIGYLRSPEYGQFDLSSSIVFLGGKSNDITVEANGTQVEDTTSLPEEVPSDVKLMEIVLEPLYNTAENSITSPVQMDRIQSLADIMHIFPETSVILTSHITPGGTPGYDLYFSIKQAESIAQLLEDEGINPERISYRAYGAQYPMVRNLESSLGMRMNDRIEIELVNDNPALIVSYKPVVVQEIFMSEAYKDFKSKTDELTFRIKSVKTNQPLDEELVSGRHVVVYNTDNEDYQVYIGMESTYSGIQNLKIKLLEQGYENLQITPFIEGKPIQKEVAKTMAESYEELATYLSFE